MPGAPPEADNLWAASLRCDQSSGADGQRCLRLIRDESLDSGRDPTQNHQSTLPGGRSSRKRPFIIKLRELKFVTTTAKLLDFLM